MQYWAHVISVDLSVMIQVWQLDILKLDETQNPIIIFSNSLSEELFPELVDETDQ